MQSKKDLWLYTIIKTIGGTDDEGNPTSEINYLQRLRQLVYAEQRMQRLERMMGQIALILRDDMTSPDVPRVMSDRGPSRGGPCNEG